MAVRSLCHPGISKISEETNASIIGCNPNNVSPMCPHLDNARVSAMNRGTPGWGRKPWLLISSGFAPISCHGNRMLLLSVCSLPASFPSASLKAEDSTAMCPNCSHVCASLQLGPQPTCKRPWGHTGQLCFCNLKWGWLVNAFFSLCKWQCLEQKPRLLPCL